jgi:hypothetical protein
MAHSAPHFGQGLLIHSPCDEGFVNLEFAPEYLTTLQALEFFHMSFFPEKPE